MSLCMYACICLYVTISECYTFDTQTHTYIHKHTYTYMPNTENLSVYVCNINIHAIKKCKSTYRHIQASYLHYTALGKAKKTCFVR